MELSPYENKIVQIVNKELELRNLKKVDERFCHHIGDVIHHLRCQGMKTSSAAQILLNAAKEVEDAPS
jgi:hypothetical protein